VTGQVTEAAMLWAVVGGLCGFLVGAISSIILGRADRSSTAVILGAIAGLCGAIGGGLTPLAVAAADGVLPPVVSSAIARGIAGSAAGVFGYGWSWWTIEKVDEEGNEELQQPEPKATTWTPSEPRRKRNLGPILRLLPILAVSAFSLVAAFVTAPSQVALALLAIGLLGLSAAGALLSQECRIRELERRLRGWR
jgi:hypothetical protein